MKNVDAEIKAFKEQSKIIGDNLRKRVILYKEMEKEKVAKVIKEKALNDVLYFFEYFAWTHDPRPKHLKLYDLNSPMLPFVLYDSQKEKVLKIVENIENGEDILVEKSRDMGVSWIVVTIFLWYWFKSNSGNDFLLGSRKEEYVDKRGAQDTLFQKFRYNLYKIIRLAPIFKPKGFNKDCDNVMFIRNPETESYIRGEANNPNFATSGRYKAILADEFSKWEETDRSAWISMGDSAQCRIPVSTPWGIGRKFADLRFNSNIDIITYHWREHPVKSAGYWKDERDNEHSIWYDRECERRRDDPTAIAQELDIDYMKSGTPYFNNKIIQNRYIQLKEQNLEFEEYEYTLTVNDTISLHNQAGGRIKILEKPVSGWDYRYCVSADIAEGLEKGDNSVFYVYDRVKGKDVAWFAGKIDTLSFSKLLIYMGHYYEDAYLAPEKNNHGHAVIQRLKMLEYPNIYFQEMFDSFMNIDSSRLGWLTNKSTRPILCDAIRGAVSEESDGVMDINFFKEALTFVTNAQGKPEAEPGCLDDRVMAQGIKFMVHQWLPAPKEYQKYHNATHEGKIPFGIPMENNDEQRAFWN